MNLLQKNEAPRPGGAFADSSGSGNSTVSMNPVQGLSKSQPFAACPLNRFVSLHGGTHG